MAMGKAKSTATAVTFMLPTISGARPYWGLFDTGCQERDNKRHKPTFPISSIAFPRTSGRDSRKIKINIRMININETNAMAAIDFSARNS